jgi:hypothetical protein
VDEGKKDRFQEEYRKGFFEKRLDLLGDFHAGAEREASLLARENVNRLSHKGGFKHFCEGLGTG